MKSRYNVDEIQAHEYCIAEAKIKGCMMYLKHLENSLRHAGDSDECNEVVIEEVKNWISFLLEKQKAFKKSHK